MKKLKNRFIGYARTSPYLIETSEDEQKTKIRKYCKKNKLKLIKIYSDNGKETGKPKRSSWANLVKCVNEGNVDGIIFTRFDRVARHLSELCSIMKIAAESKIILCSIEENITSDKKENAKMLHSLAVFSNFNRDITRQRLEEGLVKAKERGIKLGRKKKEFDKEKALAMYRKGDSHKKIADYFGVSHSTMYQRLNEWKAKRETYKVEEYYEKK